MAGPAQTVDINPYAQSFKMMRTAMLLQPDRQRDIRMFIYNDRNNDQRRYNLPLTSDVAAVFESSDGGPPLGERHLVVQPREPRMREATTYSRAVR